MKNTKGTSILTWSLLILTGYLLLVPSAVRSQTNPPNIENTQWRASITFDFGKGYGPYWFERGGKVRFSLTLTDNSGFNERAGKEHSATYKQEGTVIHIESSDHSIVAIMKENRMEGIITFKDSQERYVWVAEKESSSSNSSNASSSASVSSTGAPNQQLKLEGTTWHGAAIIFLKWSGDVDTRYFDYTFRENGRVSVQYARELTGPRPETRYNNTTQSYETTNVTKVISNSFLRDVGMYKQNGASIHMDFSDHSIDATIRSNGMEGIITLKSSGDKAKWGANKTSRDTQQGEINTSGSSTATMPSKRNDTRLSPEIPNAPKLLSIRERLPEQLEQFKRTHFKVFTYEPPKPGDKEENGAFVAENDNYPRWVSWKDEVKGAFARYGDIHIELTEFKDIVKATDCLQKHTKERSSLIVNRMLVKNVRGQSVGELVVMQNLPGKDSENRYELVMFTNGAYFYWISSPILGEAQRIQKLLPLQ